MSAISNIEMKRIQEITSTMKKTKMSNERIKQESKLLDFMVDYFCEIHLICQSFAVNKVICNIKSKAIIFR